MTKKSNINFEQAIFELEDIVSKLESGSLPLDESIDAFSNAVELIKVCEEKLSSAKQKVKILTEDENGVISDRPFTEISNET